MAKTRHVLSYIDDEALRRRVLVGLNRQERLHAMAREICFGRQGRVGDRGYEAQLNRRGVAVAAGTVVAALNFANSLATLEETQRQNAESQRQARLSAEHSRDQLELTRLGQLNERFTRAIELLGSPSRDVRIGGIYALEQIARDSPQRAAWARR